MTLSPAKHKVRVKAQKMSYMPTYAYTDNQNIERQKQAALQHIGPRCNSPGGACFSFVSRVSMYTAGYSAPRLMRLREA
ncbi:hypothetical protein C266_19590 [Pandoraea sp. SD6-2]|nr:hypothetical protein C266_19590 [Pandoraea sp. SD6-2]